MRIEEIITESAQTDRDMRIIAGRVLNGLMGRRKQPLIPAVVNYGDGVFPAAYMTTAQPDLVIALIAGMTHPSFISNTKIALISTIPERFDAIIAYPHDPINPSPMDWRSAQAAAKKLVNQSAVLIDEIKRRPHVFIHEFTHYWDIQRAGRVVPSSQEYTNDIDIPGLTPGYVNDPMERNAFFNQTMMALDKRSTDFFAMPFQQFYMRVLPMFPAGFVENLHPQNKQRIMTRLYQLWLTRNN